MKPYLRVIASEAKQSLVPPSIYVHEIAASLRSSQ